MESINIELYIIGYTLIWIMVLYLYSLPLRLIGKSLKWIRKIFNNKTWWKIF